MRALVIEKRALAFDAPTIASEIATCADDAMTRNDNGSRIACTRIGDGTGCVWVANSGRDFAIRLNVTIWNRL